MLIGSDGEVDESMSADDDEDSEVDDGRGEEILVISNTQDLKYWMAR